KMATTPSTAPTASPTSSSTAAPAPTSSTKTAPTPGPVPKRSDSNNTFSGGTGKRTRLPVVISHSRHLARREHTPGKRPNHKQQSSRNPRAHRPPHGQRSTVAHATPHPPEPAPLLTASHAEWLIRPTPVLSVVPRPPTDLH